MYGGTVTSIELLNEPGVFTGVFTMSELQDFYTEGISVVHGVDEAMNVSLSGETPTMYLVSYITRSNASQMQTPFMAQRIGPTTPHRNQPTI